MSDKSFIVNDFKFDLYNDSINNSLRVVGYFTKIGKMAELEDYSFIGTKEQLEIAKLMEEMYQYDKAFISKIPMFWDDKKNIYLRWFMQGGELIARPFL